MTIKVFLVYKMKTNNCIWSFYVTYLYDINWLKDKIFLLKVLHQYGAHIVVSSVNQHFIYKTFSECNVKLKVEQLCEKTAGVKQEENLILGLNTFFVQILLRMWFTQKKGKAKWRVGQKYKKKMDEGREASVWCPQKMWVKIVFPGAFSYFSSSMLTKT